MSKKILYLGNFSFPNGNAAGNRVYGVGKILKELGHEVSYVGLDSSLDTKSILVKTKSRFEDFDFYNLAYPHSNKKWFSYNSEAAEVINLLREGDYDIIICYGSPRISLFINRIRKWANSNSVIFLIDCVDLLAITNGSILYRTIKSLDEWFLKTFLASKAEGIISISSYISQIYSKRGVPTVIIPPVVNLEKYLAISGSYSASDVLKFVYVGVPFPTDGREVSEKGYKDRLDLAIDVLGSLKNMNYVFNIYGLTKEEYLRGVPRHQALLQDMPNIKFRGKIRNDEALKCIADSDFSILLRDVNQMTSAGFPTKFVESISCGTPVITTKTSDLDKYMVEGKTGFFVSLENKSVLQGQFETLFNLSADERIEMKQFCRDFRKFDYTKFKKKLDDFLRRILLRDERG